MGGQPDEVTACGSAERRVEARMQQPEVGRGEAVFPDIVKQFDKPLILLTVDALKLNCDVRDAGECVASEEVGC